MFHTASCSECPYIKSINVGARALFVRDLTCDLRTRPGPPATIGAATHLAFIVILDPLDLDPLDASDVHVTQARQFRKND
jgi:hypothetical protein